LGIVDLHTLTQANISIFGYIKMNHCTPHSEFYSFYKKQREKSNKNAARESGCALISMHTNEQHRRRPIGCKTARRTLVTISINSTLSILHYLVSSVCLDIVIRYIIDTILAIILRIKLLYFVFYTLYKVSKAPHNRTSVLLTGDRWPYADKLTTRRALGTPKTIVGLTSE
jgi:hypothetical protein